MPKKRTLSPQAHAEIATTILRARNAAFSMVVSTLGPALIAKGSKTLPAEVSAASAVVNKLDAIVKLLLDDLRAKHPAAPNCYANDDFKPSTLHRNSSALLSAEERAAVIDALSACHSSNLGVLAALSSAFPKAGPILTGVSDLDTAVNRAIELLRKASPEPVAEILPPEPAAMPSVASSGEIAALYDRPFEQLGEPAMVRRNMRDGMLIDHRILAQPLDLTDLKAVRIVQASAHHVQKVGLRVAENVLKQRSADRMQELVERLKRGSGDTPSEASSDQKERKP